jgi:hypothetical protein
LCLFVFYTQKSCTRLPCLNNAWHLYVNDMNPWNNKFHIDLEQTHEVYTFVMVLIQVSHLSKLLKMFKKWKTWTPCHCLRQKNLSKICMLLSNLKRHLCKPIFISHHVMCSLINSCCYNHLNNMLMNVKLIVIQLELNDMGYKFVIHNYSKFASNT